MGTVLIAIEIANPLDSTRSVILDKVVVDTGASIAAVPRSIADELGLPIFARRVVRTIESRLEMDIADAMLTIGGERTMQEVMVSDTYDQPLIGVIPLESLGFAVDPVNKRIVPVELLLL